MGMRAGLVLAAMLVAVAVLPVVLAPEAAGVVWCDGQVATIVGTPGPDVIQGTEGPDVIAGLGGDDQIWGYGGPDCICGGDGDDWIWGGDGTNRIRGNAGDDVLSGGMHFDTIWGGRGHDEISPGWGPVSRVYGGAGRDRILLYQVEPGDDHLVDGGAGRDTLDLTDVWLGPGGRGVCVELKSPAPNLTACRVQVNVSTTPPPGSAWATRLDTGPVGSSFVTSIEKVFGTPGNDSLEGDDRPNRLRGMGGNDYLDGQGGKDRLLAGPGTDLLMGGMGDDRLVGGPDTDALNGEAGTDVCRTGEVLENCEA